MAAGGGRDRFLLHAANDSYFDRLEGIHTAVHRERLEAAGRDSRAKVTVDNDGFVSAAVPKQRVQRRASADVEVTDVYLHKYSQLSHTTLEVLVMC